jgi:hypothetical protein
MVEEIPVSFQNFQNETAFVIQGPLDKNSSVLFEVIDLYLDKYPGVVIILSLWISDSKYIRQDLHENPRIFLILNEDPDYPGISNINRQIVTSRSGLLFAKSLGRKFSLKLRTDQFMLGSAALKMLFFQKELFIDQRADHPRILGLSRNTFKHRLYSFSDMFHFGVTESLIKYWDCELDMRTPEDLQNINLSDWEQYGKANLVETYLQVNYMKRLGIEPTYTHEHSLKMYGLLFVIIDESEIGLVWNKYSSNSHPWTSSNVPNKFEELKFSEWLYHYNSTKETA